LTLPHKGGGLLTSYFSLDENTCNGQVQHYSGFGEVSAQKTRINQNLKSGLGREVEIRGSFMTSIDLSSADIDDIDLLLLLDASKPSGTTAKQSEETTGRSRAVLLPRLKKLAEKGLCIRKEIPHRNPGMPPTYVYELSPNIFAGDIQKVRQKLISLSQGNTQNFETIEIDELENKNDTRLPFSQSTLSTIEALNQIRAANRQSHLLLLKLIIDNGQITISQVVKRTERKVQTVHLQIEKLRKLGFLERFKRSDGGTKEFIYFISSQVKKEELASYIASELPRDDTQIKADTSAPLTTKDEVKAEITEMLNQTASTSSNQPSKNTSDDSVVWARLLLEKFPDFDPSWSEDVQTKWFEAFDRLMKMGEVKKSP
jgi:predicted transcriptional regulator